MPKILHPKLFPSCPRNLAFNFPGNFTLDQMMEFYWRVKRWNISANGTFSRPPPATPGTLAENFSLAVGRGEGRGGFEWEYPGIEAASEEVLVCGPGALWGFSIFQPVGDAIVAFGASATGGLGSVSCEVFSSITYDGTFYHTNMFFFGNNGGLGQASFSTDSGGFPNVSQAGNFVITINSGVISAPIYTRYFDGFQITLNITMQAAEWWSYGGTWNTSTGLPT